MLQPPGARATMMNTSGTGAFHCVCWIAENMVLWQRGIMLYSGAGTQQQPVHNIAVNHSKEAAQILKTQ